MAESIRVAAAGDIHCAEPLRERITHAFAALDGQADVVLLAGDLTTHGEPEQAAVLADACRPLDDARLRGARQPRLPREPLRRGGRACSRTRASACSSATTPVLEVGELELGIVGGKGFVGGFPGAELPDFGEPLLREVYAETTREVDALEAGLEAISGCHRRIVLLHYAPVPETLVGEPETIWAFLGSSRLAAPIGAHRPDLVLHGHAHRGSFAADLGPVPVRNVAVHVIGKDFEHFEL